MAESSVRSIDVKQKYEEFHALCEKLLALKQTISRANAGISDKLVELSELKTLLTHLKSIPCSEETQNTYTSEVKFVAVIKKPQLLEEMAALQARIDACQDTIDEFNARTRIEFEL